MLCCIVIVSYSVVNLDHFFAVFGELLAATAAAEEKTIWVGEAKYTPAVKWVISIVMTAWTASMWTPR